MKQILVFVFSVGILLLSACAAQPNVPEISTASDRAGITESTLPRQAEQISSLAGNEAAETTHTENTAQPTQPTEPQPGVTAEPPVTTTPPTQKPTQPPQPPQETAETKPTEITQPSEAPAEPPDTASAPVYTQADFDGSSRRSELMRKAMQHRASGLSGRTAWRFLRMSDTSGCRISDRKAWTARSAVCNTMWIRSSKLRPIRSTA